MIELMRCYALPHHNHKCEGMEMNKNFSLSHNKELKGNVYESAT